MFIKGAQNFDVEIEKNKLKNLKEQKKQRLFAKKGGSLTFVCVDDPEIGLNEHQLMFAGQHNYNNFYNCLGDSCPICHAGHKPSFVSLFTTFDLTPWDKDGKRHSFAKRIYSPKSGEIAALAKLRQDFGGSLEGAVLILTKGSGAKDRATLTPYLRSGSIMKYTKQQLIDIVVKDGYKPDLAQPFNYEAVFANDSIAALQAAIPRILAPNGQGQQRANNNYSGQDFGQHQGYGQQHFIPDQGYQGEPAYSQPPQQFYPQNAPQQNAPYQATQPFPIPGQGQAYNAPQNYNQGNQQSAPQAAVPVYAQRDEIPLDNIPF